VFGLLKRNKGLKNFAVAANVQSCFEHARHVSPAGAYLFARTLKNTEELLQARDTRIDQKISVIESNIAELMRDGLPADGGIGLLALQFAHLLLMAEKSRVPEATLLSVAYSEIVKHGERYRDLEQRDETPPSNSFVRQQVQAANCDTVASLIRTLRSEGQRAGQRPEEIDRDGWTILALLDFRADMAKEKVLHALDQLRGAIHGQ
jgi:hypothetical protein